MNRSSGQAGDRQQPDGGEPVERYEVHEDVYDADDDVEDATTYRSALTRKIKPKLNGRATIDIQCILPKKS